MALVPFLAGAHRVVILPWSWAIGLHLKSGMLLSDSQTFRISWASVVGWIIWWDAQSVGHYTQSRSSQTNDMQGRPSVLWGGDFRLTTMKQEAAVTNEPTPWVGHHVGHHLIQVIEKRGKGFILVGNGFSWNSTSQTLPGWTGDHESVLTHGCFKILRSPSKLP